jgi:hypothetical protein
VLAVLSFGFTLPTWALILEASSAGAWEEEDSFEETSSEEDALEDVEEPLKPDTGIFHLFCLDT